MKIEEKFAPIRKGFLELAVLQIVSAKNVYAADILERLQETEFATQEGTLYPLIGRLRRESLIDDTELVSEVGPPRKYLTITQKGTEQLAILLHYHHLLTATLLQLGTRE